MYSIVTHGRSLDLDHTSSHIYNVGMEHVGFSPGKLSGALGRERGWCGWVLRHVVRQVSCFLTCPQNVCALETRQLPVCASFFPR